MKGDFIGFSFDGIHCATLGITHVSSGDRYDEELFPEINDKTIEIPNNNGEYYYGSTYGVKHHSLNIAFDSITEKQFRDIRRLFGTNKICELIFDERPYKVYYAKLESPIELSYVCFDEVIYEEIIYSESGIYDREAGARRDLLRKVPKLDSNGNELKQRIYKGEGKIDFISYSPFARQLYKSLDLYTSGGSLITQYTNVDEWKESSGILTQAELNKYNIDKVVSVNNGVYTYAIPVYNPGDLNVGFCLYIPFVNGKVSPASKQDVIIINADDDYLCLREIVRKNSNDTGILINTNNHLIEGVVFSYVANLSDYRKPSWKTTGTIYNDYIAAGDFPHIKRDDWKLDDIHQPQGVYISCAAANKNMSIYYNYLYF